MIRLLKQHYERPHLRRRSDGILRGVRDLCALLRETVGETMENVIVGIIALLLFGYLFLAMIRPEKF